MRLCLVNLKFEKGNITNFRRQEHLGLGYIGGMCERRGHDVTIINAQFDSIEKEDVMQQILDVKPDAFGLTLYEELLDDSIEVIQFVKKCFPDAVIIVGGHYATFNAENLMKKVPQIDYVSAGEGEVSFPELLDALEHGTEISAIRGIWYIKNECIEKNGFGEVFSNLDELPYPIRQKTERRNRITNISASRGCYGNCSFCSTKSFYEKQEGMKIRIRNPISVVNEIEFMVKRDHAYHFFFTDDNFMVTEKMQNGWIDEFVAEIEKRNLKIVFNFDCRVNDVDKELLGKLKRVGLIGVFLGVESNSPKTLKLYNKNTSNELNVQAVNILRRLRIDYWIGNIMFHPLTKLEDIQYDIEYFNAIHYCLFFNYSNPITSLAGKLKVYKGTAIYDELMEKGCLRDNGLSCSYNFLDEKVEQFYNFICEAKYVVNDLVELDPIYMIELCNSHNIAETAMKIHTIARQYMDLDFDMFCSMHKYLMENRIQDDYKDYTRRVIEEGKEKARLLYIQLKEIKSDMYQKGII